MDNLLPIGRFSKVCRLSVKALRHYDEVGLLCPAVVDPHSGYRYYTYAQANRAEAIRVLRSLDMSLPEISEALDSAETDAVEAVLERHRLRLESELARHQRMLSYLRRLIEREEGVMPYKVTVRETPAQHTLVVRRRTTMRRIAETVAAGYAQLAAEATRAGVALAGPPFLVMADVIDQDSDGEIELGFPVAARYQGSGEVAGAEDPAMSVASVIHRGPYDEIGPAYHTLQGWIQEHGHEVAGPPREVYLNDASKVAPADLVTEVWFPIR